MELCQDLETNPEKLASANVSKLFRHNGNFDWCHIEKAVYKSGDDSWNEVSRRVFVGETGESPLFHTRYFEIAQNGFSTLEHHQHEHVVVVLRGRGMAIVGQKRVQMAFGDVLYVAPNEVHQLSNSEVEPFGFLCIVNAQRDKPVPVVLGQGSTCC